MGGRGEGRDMRVDSRGDNRGDGRRMPFGQNRDLGFGQNRDLGPPVGRGLGRGFGRGGGRGRGRGYDEDRGDRGGEGYNTRFPPHMQNQYHQPQHNNSFHQPSYPHQHQHHSGVGSGPPRHNMSYGNGDDMSGGGESTMNAPASLLQKLAMMIKNVKK